MELIYWTIFFWREFTIDTCAFQFYVNFFFYCCVLRVAKRHFRCSRSQIFLCWPTVMGRRLKVFLKILWDLHFGGGISVSFIRKERKNSLSFFFYQANLKKSFSFPITCIARKQVTRAAEKTFFYLIQTTILGKILGKK